MEAPNKAFPELVNILICFFFYLPISCNNLFVFRLIPFFMVSG
ncbi:hypothetical protein JCM19301_2886 [Jejuia pallidilutea]|nr:hypothetical protein JCM19301_2886 [Jejuia pallidilutea]